MGGWRRPETLVIDIDSLPVEVHGEQRGSAWNGYYRRRVYHPIVASAGETGDIVDLRLREGQVHTADGRARGSCRAAVRFDDIPAMAALSCASRCRAPGQQRPARRRRAPHLDPLVLPVVVPLVVQVVVERPGELIPRCTSMPSGDRRALLALYRKRGKARGPPGRASSV